MCKENADLVLQNDFCPRGIQFRPWLTRDAMRRQQGKDHSSRRSTWSRFVPPRMRRDKMFEVLLPRGLQ